MIRATWKKTQNLLLVCEKIIPQPWPCLTLGQAYIKQGQGHHSCDLDIWHKQWGFGVKVKVKVTSHNYYPVIQIAKKKQKKDFILQKLQSCLKVNIFFALSIQLPILWNILPHWINLTILLAVPLAWKFVHFNSLLPEWPFSVC